MFKKHWYFCMIWQLPAQPGFSCFFVRFNFEIPPSEIYDTIVAALPVVLLAQSSMNVSFGLYSGLWRFASLQDILNILKSAIFGVAIISVILFITNRLEFIPRTTVILYPLFLIGFS